MKLTERSVLNSKSLYFEASYQIISTSYQNRKSNGKRLVGVAVYILPYHSVIRAISILKWLLYSVDQILLTAIKRTLGFKAEIALLLLLTKSLLSSSPHQKNHVGFISLLLLPSPNSIN